MTVRKALIDESAANLNSPDLNVSSHHAQLVEAEPRLRILPHRRTALHD